MPRSIKALATAVLAVRTKGRRRLVALAGPPASGKSTLAAALVDHLNALGEKAVLVPMDGFHLDNAVLEPRGLVSRKGAPETFDAGGFVRLVQALGTEEEIAFPVFDRTGDCTIAGAGMVSAAHRTVVIEGNYLLLNRAPWIGLASLWDYSVLLDVPRDVLRDRLVARWVTHGLSHKAAVVRAEGNDMRNADVVAGESRGADLVWSEVAGR